MVYVWARIHATIQFTNGAFSGTIMQRKLLRRSMDFARTRGRSTQIAMNDSGGGGRTEITTGSRLRTWWLKNFRGYAVETKKRTPHENAFGEIYYKNLWVLTKEDKK